MSSQNTKPRRYSFLTRAPTTSQKKQPALPPPVPPVNVAFQFPAPTTTVEADSSIRTTRRRSSTFASINNWALAVQPGTPEPLTPRRLSVSGSLRRPSVSAQNALQQQRDGEEKEEQSNDRPFDLTNLGYTSVFVSLPPATPAAESESKHKRFRSLSIANPLRKSTAATTTTKSKPPKKKKDLPPTLASELMLMQALDGGSIESHARRLGISGQVCRDDRGTMWCERDRAEYQPLLQPPSRRESQDTDAWKVKKEKKEKEKRKPAPLNLDAARKDFVDSSFAPQTAPANQTKVVKSRKTSVRANVKGIF